MWRSLRQYVMPRIYWFTFLLVGRIKPIKTREIRNQAESTIFKDLFKLKFVDANKLNRTAQGLNRIWKERIFFPHSLTG